MNIDASEVKQLSASFFDICETCFEEGSPWSKQQFVSFFDQTHHQYITIKAKEKIVGFLLISIVYDEAEIELIAVQKSSQREGVGKQLFNQGLRLLQDKDVSRLLIEVRESNQQAQSFYLGLGFKEIGRRKNYYRKPHEDALIWNLDL